MFGEAAVEAAAAGDYDAADDFLNYVASDAICDDYSELASLQLLTLGKNDAAMESAERQAVANAESIAAAIEPFYGAAAKASFFKLLAAHYGSYAGKLVTA